METKFTSASEKKTFELAKNLALKLKGGDVIGLTGDLGSGKTTFTKGLAKALGIKDIVNSPTFNLMKLYELPEKNKKKIGLFCHIDTYRMLNANDLVSIGALEYMGRKDAVTIIEWADKVLEALPKNTLIVDFAYGGGNKRTITFNL